MRIKVTDEEISKATEKSPECAKYYAISPKIVKVFGKYAWFNKIFKKVLDKKVSRLSKKGFENTPYND